MLSQEVTPGKQYRMMPYWVYSASAPIDSSPAVANELAFTGDQSGTVSAVRIGTGALAWSAAAGGPVESTPAVDHAAGLVVVGSSDGAISAYLARTGKLAWRTSTSAAVKSSPLIYNGTVYVASENTSCTRSRRRPERSGGRLRLPGRPTARPRWIRGRPPS